MTADQLNTLGFRCHRESRFEASAHFFKLAIHEDPKHALAAQIAARSVTVANASSAVPHAINACVTAW